MDIRAILTEREEAILAQIAAGRTNHQIAATLCLSRYTVQNHVQHIFQKLRVSSRAEAVSAHTLCQIKHRIT
jgi:DNA-binding NarL/FixJ family response regulator